MARIVRDRGYGITLNIETTKPQFRLHGDDVHIQIVSTDVVLTRQEIAEAYRLSTMPSSTRPDRRAPAVYTYTVEGTGEFPKDMLRYDDSLPLGDDDRKLVEAEYGRDDGVLFDARNDRLRVLRVNLVADHMPPSTSEARWRSFTWRVVVHPHAIPRPTRERTE